MKKIISGFIYSLSVIATVSFSLFAVSCTQEELAGNPSSGIGYNVTCANIDGRVISKSALSFEGSDIPLCLNTYEGIDVCSLQSKQIETRGTMYNNGDLLTSFKVCAFNGNKELFYDKEVVWDGNMWKSDENIEWPYGKSLRFLAYANEPETNFVLSSYPDLTTFDFGLEANAADQRDVLLGYYNGPGNPTGTADIEFQHPMTAVIFKLGNIVTPNFASVKSITLTGVASKGQFNTPTSVGDEDASWTIPEDEKYSFAVNLTESSSGLGLPVSDDGTIGEAFLLIPQNLAEHHVRVEVKFNLMQSKTFTLTARLDQGEWKRGCTNIYTIGYVEELSDYVFTVDNPYFSFVNTSLKSEKTLKVTSHCQNANLGSREALPFEMEYSLDGGESWAPYDVQAQEQTGITAAVSSPSSNVYTVTLTSPKKANAIEMPKNRWADDSVVAFNWDLSKCDVGGEGYNASNPQNTANTYIVKHPGTYRFPCVYGNSVRNGMATDAGYRSSVSGESVVSVLMNAIGNGIGSAYILEDVSSLEDFHPRAALLWTDAKGTDGKVVVNNVELNYDAAAPKDAYISFSTSDKSALVHGNAYIILYNDKDNNGSYGPVELKSTTTGSSLLTKDIVLWSWQIWITDADLSAESTFEIGSTEGTTGHARLMNRFLGWNDGDVEGTVTYYAPNPGFENFKLRVIQRYSGNICTVDISQEEIYCCAKGSAPYYQYGRNIPVRGAYTRTTTIKKGYNADGDSYSQTTFTGQAITDPVIYYLDNSKTTTREQAITYMVNGLKLPQLFIKAAGWDRWFTNLWSLNNNAAGTDIQTVKTVYDPSPYGYKIPNFGLLADNLISKHSFIRAPGSSSGDDYIGINYYNESTHSGIFFPSTGARKHDYSSIINAHYPNLMTSSIYQKADYGYNQMYIAVFGSNNTFFKSSELIYKGCAAPILPILDE